MNEAEKADRVLVMNDGKIISDGTPENVFFDVELLKENGLDVPQTTELLYKISLKGIKCPTNVISVEETADVLAELL